MKTIAVLLAAALATAPCFAAPWDKHYEYSAFTFASKCHDGPQMDFPGGDLVTTYCPHDHPVQNDPTVFIKHNEGRSFSFLSFDLIAMGAEIRSSKGGYLATDMTFPSGDDWVPLHYDLGTDFKDVMWVSVLAYFADDHGSVALHNLLLVANTCEDPSAPGCTSPAAISEPGTLTLLAIGFSGLVGLGWHRRWQAKQPV